MYEYGFFPSSDGDRVYSAEQFGSIFDGIISGNGVFSGYLNALAVIKSDDIPRRVSIDTGRAWLNHTWLFNKTIENIDLPLASTGVSRIDAICLIYNKSSRSLTIGDVRGTQGAEPSKPELSKTDELYHMPLAYVTIDASGITNVEDTRGTEECPFITGPLEHITADTLFRGWIDDLNAVITEWSRKISQIDRQAGAEVAKLMFTNVPVTTNMWVDEREKGDPTFENFPFYAEIPLSGVINTQVPEVIFSLNQIESGIFCPVCKTFAISGNIVYDDGSAHQNVTGGGVKIFASEAATWNMTIPTIIVWNNNTRGTGQ